MDNERPLMLLRARIAEDDSGGFARWFQGVHMTDARRIPGVARVEAARTPDGTWLGMYTFESAEKLQAALGSPEAAYARGTWDRWAPRLEELSIEMFAPVRMPPIYPYSN